VSEQRLIFDWPTRHRIHLLLPCMILVAALAHGAIFFLFTIVYPHTQKDGLKPAQVFFLPADSVQISEIEEALYSQDPALFAPGGGLPRADDDFQATYTPQYAQSEPGLIPLALKFPVSKFFDTPKEPVEIHHQSTPTRLQVSTSTGPSLVAQGPLTRRLPRIPETVVFPSSTETPAPALFLVGARDNGVLDYVVLQQSSGNEELDRAGMNYLRSATSSPSAGSGTQWDFVEIQWGSRPQPLAQP